MSKKRSLDTHFWNDTYIEYLSPKEKLVFIYLITCPLSNMLGVYEIKKRRISFDTGLEIEEVEESFERLRKDKKIEYIDGFLILANFVKNQSYNTNMLKSAVKEIEGLPVSVLESGIFKKLFESFQRLSKDKGILPKIEVEVESEYEIEKESESDFSNDSKTSEISVSPETKGEKILEEVQRPLLKKPEVENNVPGEKEFITYFLAKAFHPEYIKHLYDSHLGIGWRTKSNGQPITDWQRYFATMHKYQRNFLKEQIKEGGEHEQTASAKKIEQGIDNYFENN